LRRWQEEADTDALDELLRFEVGVLKQRLRGRPTGGDPAASVSDLAQEAVFRFLRLDSAPHFEEPRQLRAYLWKAAWHLLVARVRESGRVTRLSGSESGGLDGLAQTTGGIGALERREGGDALRLVVHLLRPVDREILELVYFDELGIDGAALELAVDRSVANTRLVRARRNLGQKLLKWSELID
jgi:RNA polymerase sigma factor (sigma-70 family)